MSHPAETVTQAAKLRFGAEAAAVASLTNGLTAESMARVMAAILESATADEMIDRVESALE